MNANSAYAAGFLQKCGEYGATADEAVALLKRAQLLAGIRGAYAGVEDHGLSGMRQGWRQGIRSAQGITKAKQDLAAAQSADRNTKMMGTLKSWAGPVVKPLKHLGAFLSGGSAAAAAGDAAWDSNVAKRLAGNPTAVSNATAALSRAQVPRGPPLGMRPPVQPAPAATNTPPAEPAAPQTGGPGRMPYRPVRMAF